MIRSIQRNMLETFSFNSKNQEIKHQIYTSENDCFTTPALLNDDCKAKGKRNIYNKKYDSQSDDSKCVAEDIDNGILNQCVNLYSYSSNATTRPNKKSEIATHKYNDDDNEAVTDAKIINYKNEDGNQKIKNNYKLSILFLITDEKKKKNKKNNYDDTNNTNNDVGGRSSSSSRSRSKKSKESNKSSKKSQPKKDKESKNEKKKKKKKKKKTPLLSILTQGVTNLDSSSFAIKNSEELQHSSSSSFLLSSNELHRKTTKNQHKSKSCKRRASSVPSPKLKQNLSLELSSNDSELKGSKKSFKRQKPTFLAIKASSSISSNSSSRSSSTSSGVFVDRNSALPNLNELKLLANSLRMLKPTRIITGRNNDSFSMYTNLNEDNRVIQLRREPLNIQVYNIYGLIKTIPSGCHRPNLPPTFNSKFWLKLPPVYQYGTDDDNDDDGRLFNSNLLNSNLESVVNNDFYGCDMLAANKTDEIAPLSKSLSSFSMSDNLSDARNLKTFSNNNDATSSSSEILYESNQDLESGIQKSSSTSSIECPYSTFNIIKNESIMSQHKKYEYETNSIISKVPTTRGSCNEYADFGKFYKEMFQRRDNLNEEGEVEEDDVDDESGNSEIEEEDYLDYYDETLDEYYCDFNENSYEMNKLKFDYETRLLQLEREQRENNYEMQQKIYDFQRLAKQNRVVFYEPNGNSEEELTRYEANLPCLPDIDPNFVSGILNISNSPSGDQIKVQKSKRSMGSVLKNLRQSSIVNLSVIAEESSSFEVSSNSSSNLAENNSVKNYDKDLKNTIKNTKNSNFNHVANSLSYSSYSSSSENCENSPKSTVLSKKSNTSMQTNSKFNLDLDKLEIVYV
jgi:hypothetical protein